MPEQLSVSQHSYATDAGKSAVDLHCHSTASDGKLSPSDLVMRAASKGVKQLALTDHDTTLGIDEARRKSIELGVNLITGVELSCDWNGQNIHIVGLNFDESSDAMLSAMKQQLKARQSRAELIAERLDKKITFDKTIGGSILERATHFASGNVPGRPHFAQVLVEMGAVNDFNHAFKKYLGAGKIGDVRSFWPALPEVVNWINVSNGIAVIAHPRKYAMTATKLRKLIDTFKVSGGQAIEVLTSGQKQGDTGFLNDLCHCYGLLASMGSDFHDPKFPWTDFGQQSVLPEKLTPVWHDF